MPKAQSITFENLHALVVVLTIPSTQTGKNHTIWNSFAIATSVGSSLCHKDEGGTKEAPLPPSPLTLSWDDDREYGRLSGIVEWSIQQQMVLSHTRRNTSKWGEYWMMCIP